ncbi:MAG: hypothetical protein KKA19_00870 [Candidatus Margulisbacteria bacterium]|nr:hypothetical protein [Candidatus Margulisiibacteriota bacterium]
MEKVINFFKNNTLLVWAIGLLILSEVMTFGLGRLVWSIPLTILLALSIAFGFVANKAKLFSKVVAKVTGKKISIPDITILISALGLMYLALYLSLIGPYANHISGNFYAHIFYFMAAVIIGSIFLGIEKENVSQLFSPIPLLIALGIVITANKFFNVYGLLIFTHLLSFYLILVYFLRLSYVSPHDSPAFLEIIAQLYIPIAVLLMNRGMMQVIIRYYFKTGLILNHNYATIGLFLGFLVPYYLQNTNLKKILYTPALFLPALLSFLFYGEAGAIYLLTLAFSTMLFSFLNKTKYQWLNIFSLTTFIISYYGRRFFIDKPPLALEIRLGLVIVLLFFSWLLYIRWGWKEESTNQVSS